MKVELRELEIELIAETDHERDALERLHHNRTVEVKPGKSTDHNYPSDLLRTNIILCLPDPNNWGS